MGIGNDTASHILLECVQCKQNFQNLKDSDTHVKETHHRVKARFQCPKCEKYFGNYQILQLHLRVHDSGDQKTDTCQMSESNVSNEEESTVHENKEECETAFTDQILSATVQCNSKKSSTSQDDFAAKKAVGLTKVRLEDCLRCDACSCIYIDKNDYNKHMKNFHRTNSVRKPKQKKGCRSCCKHCNCQGDHMPQNIQNERGNNNLFHFNIKDRWTKMVSCRLSGPEIKCEIKCDPDGESSEIPNLVDYTHLLSQVEVKIKTEPPDEIEPHEFSE